MRKLIIGIIAVVSLAMLASCAGGDRSREDLPQITRMDRADVSAASAATLAGLQAAAGGAATGGTVVADVADGVSNTFYVNEDGVIVFNLWNQTDATHPISLGLIRFAELVEELSDGEMMVNIRYRAGNDGDLLAMVNNNQLDAAIITIWSAWQSLTPLANLEALPFMFTNYEDAWAAYEGTLGDWVTANIIVPSGSRALGFWTNGLRHFTNNVRPITTPADMIGLRMRSPQTTTHLAMYEAFGSASLALPFGQVHAGLAAGTFDGQDNPLGNIHAARLYEVQRYLTISNHMFSSAPMIASTNFWYSLSAEHQQVLQEASLLASRYQGALTVAMETTQLMQMEAAGVIVNTVDMTPFIAASIPIWAEHMERYGNDIATIAARYISDTNSLAHQFAD